MTRRYAAMTAASSVQPISRSGLPIPHTVTTYRFSSYCCFFVVDVDLLIKPHKKTSCQAKHVVKVGKCNLPPSRQPQTAANKFLDSLSLFIKPSLFTFPILSVIIKPFCNTEKTKPNYGKSNCRTDKRSQHQGSS